jgi:hypothetical protein
MAKIPPQKNPDGLKPAGFINIIYSKKYDLFWANYFAIALSKAALFLAIWLCFGSAERLPASKLVAIFKNCTSNLEVVLFFRSFLFKRVTPMVL